MLIALEIRSWNDRWKNLSAEDYLRLRKAIPMLPEEKPEWGYKVVADMDGIDLLNELGIDAAICKDEQIVALKTMIVKLAEKYDPSKKELVQTGALCQISVPNMELMRVRRVMVLEDACTDNLQSHLKDNWKILAVCPPVSQRRPDYILGRNDD